MARSFQRDLPQGLPKQSKLIIIIVLAVVIIVPLGMRCFRTVEAGHVAVATLFGNPRLDTYDPGLHFVNPLYQWHLYDARQKTHMETASVPSQDQLSTAIDVSVQYRINGKMAGQILAETGSAATAVEVHLVPKVRSLLREQGKTIARAEDFFKEETQVQLQTALSAGLQEFLGPVGIDVQGVLIRDITLSPQLIRQIEGKKEEEQLAERAKAELDRKTTEAKIIIVEAEAQRGAAEQQAMQQKILADARAYEIEAINKAIATNPAYIQLEALMTLQAISKDPAAKLYFMNSDSPMPLPLMNIGQPLTE